MHLHKNLFLSFVFATFLATTNAQADLTITVTASPLGGTQWAFSNGSGIVIGSGSHFLPGGTPSNPQNFYASNDEHIGVSVLAGLNTFGIQNIFVRNYGGLPGTNGSIFDGLDFQSSLPSIAGFAIASLNGLVLHAGQFDFSSLNPGNYVFDSYYTGYSTNLGTVTFNVGVPEPSVFALSSLGLLAFGFVGSRRRRRP